MDDCRRALTVLFVLSTKPLPSGWYAVVCVFRIPNICHTLATR
ncbi:unnamed protein product [Schistosoma curassoni]|uniref:Uncharacterized protein n=1 Tax=Schistosoma curassoni TaxID=6186 RepID=A0A183KEX3_9TREM|nr:unnamed protein product [Schistosoma curassoni]